MTSESQKPYQHCNDENDAYYPVCSKLKKLCPRLVPSPLWGLSLANIARMAPQAALAVCDSCPETVERVYRYWTALNRSGKCEVCGDPGNELDEEWLYCIFDERGNLVRDLGERNPLPGETRRYQGIAYLRGLKLLCEKCHLAKHQGYALVHRREQEALKHLARIHQLHLDEAKNLVGEAFFIHHQLSKIHNWTIKIGKLIGLDEELRGKVETLLNTMYRKGFSVAGGWLYYQYPKYYEEVEPRIIRETIAILSEVSKRARTTNVADSKWIESLLETIKEELEPKNIHVLDREFKLFINYLLENEKHRKILQRVIDYATKSEANHLTSPIPILLEYTGLTGKWMVFVPTSLYPRVFRYMLETLESSKLAYSAKITARRNEYASRRELPIITYVPVSLAPRYILDVAEIMRSVLKEINISKRMFFKPDIFTVKGLYSSKGMKYKSYIFVY